MCSPSRRNRSPQFRAFCERERCLFAVVGVATEERQLVVDDGALGNAPVDMPMDVLLGKPPKMQRDVKTRRTHASSRST